jgi:hypothetical protein
MTRTMAATAIGLIMALLPAPGTAQAVQSAAPSGRARILVHVTQGPENPTRAALAFLVAKTALDEGDAVTRRHR